MDGQVTGKGFSSYQVNEALLARVVEAIKKGEADARRYSQLRSFELYYDGFRERLVFGRIMIVPAKLADSPEDFPSALLYGAMVKEITPEEQADLYSFKLGESEYDEYDPKQMKTIKEKLFTDAAGVLRSVIIFIPTWANVRDFVIFKMTRDWDLLARMVRQQVFAAYFDPRFSSAFDQLCADTEKLNVSDITPKLDYPGMAEGLAQSFPDLELAAEDNQPEPSRPNLQPGDGLTKHASTKKPIMLLAADNVEDISERFLEPEEKAVIDNLSAELKDRVEGEQKTPSEVADKQAADKTAAEQSKTAKYEQKIWHEGGIVRYELYKVNFLGGKKKVTYGFAPDEQDAQKKINKKLEELGVRLEGEPLSVYAAESAEPACKRCGTVTKKGAYCGGVYCAKEHKGLGEVPQEKEAKIVDGKRVDDTGAETGLRAHPDYNESTSHCNEANELAKQGAKVAAEKPAEKSASLAIEGATLTINNGNFYAKAASGHVEKLRINGKQIKWVRPLQFTAAFRSAAETFIRNPRNHKKADVPLTFDDIWNDITEPMGPAPSIELKGAPKTDGSENKSEPNNDANRHEEKDERPSSEEREANAGKSKLEKMEARRSEDGKTAKVAAASATQKDMVIGWCEVCNKGVLKSNGSEVAPNFFLHATCQVNAKKAAFDMFIPSQVAREFYPEVLQEIVDFPGGEVGDKDGHDPAIGLPGESPTGVPQSADGIPGNGDAYISTKPAQAMGIGNDGHPQILEGAPLRLENDIRGYQFDQEYYAQQQNLNPRAFVAAYVVERINKKASTEEFQAQFADFLKRAMGEIAAAFIALFKITSRPPMNKVPGTGEVQLDQVEVSGQPLPPGTTNVGSRVRYLMSKLTDSQIQEAINGAWAQSAVWNGDESGGYTYEVFIRPDSIDKTTTVLRYEFVVGTKGL